MASLIRFGFILFALGLASRASALETVHSNDNRVAAGAAANREVVLKLDARIGEWRPSGNGANAQRIQVAAFSEENGVLLNPGPLLRVRAGTRVRVSVRNSLALPLWIYGLGENRGRKDSALIQPGASREFSFTAGSIGTFYYSGRTTADKLSQRLVDDAQLNGVIVVDPAAGAIVPDRIFVITSSFGIQPSTVSGLAPGAALTINGLSFPHTEKLSATVGDSIHWRVVNVSSLDHPMHLHGVYYRVDAKGDGNADTLYTRSQRRNVVTEFLPVGRTMSMTWSPARSGNWIFHCHFASHIVPEQLLEADRKMPVSGGHAGHHDMADHMAGLVLGITVKPRGVIAEASSPQRHLRLVLRSRAKVYGEFVGYSVALGGSRQDTDDAPLTVPGPTLILEKDKPVAITIENRTHEPAAIHWHGIELDSYPDGVPDISGEGKNILRAVAPGGSLTVQFTPPRAGTFMYHSHFNEMQQISSGMYGAIVVEDPKHPRNPKTDRVLLFSEQGPWLNFFTSAPAATLLNGAVDPAPLDLTPGVPSRLRLINIRTDNPIEMSLLDSSGEVKWRIVAKDGAKVPASQSHLRSSQLHMAPGEIYDVEVVPKRGVPLTLKYWYLDPKEKTERDLLLTSR